MPYWPVIDNFPVFIRNLTARYSSDEIARATGISVEELERWRHGSNHYLPRHEWVLYGFCYNRRAFDLLSEHVGVLPTHDISGINQRDRLDSKISLLTYKVKPPDVRLANRPTVIAGYPVNFPLGFAAHNAAVDRGDSEIVASYAANGFDSLTYKTVRSIRVDPHPAPNWVFIRSDAVDALAPPFDQTVVGDPYFFPDDPSRDTMANSFGNPSWEPTKWMPDVEKARRSLRPGQVLIVSVHGTLQPADAREETLAADFVRVAQYAKEAGADVIEANYSCPNVPGERAGDLYKDPELSGRVSAAMKRALGTTPLFVKIGYLDRPHLAEFMRYNRPYVQGIVAINTIPVRLVSPDRITPLFPGTGRERAGISGAGIRKWAQEVVGNLVEIRERERARDELAIVAVGGVISPRDVYDYLNLGADAVESCTGAYFNPYLAIETRAQLAPLEKETAAIRVNGRESEHAEQPAASPGKDPLSGQSDQLQERGRKGVNEVKEREPVTDTGEREKTTGKSKEKLAITPSAIGGAIIGGVVAGNLLGPVGAVAGFIAGGVAGEIFDRSTQSKKESSGGNRPGQGPGR